MNSVLSWFTGKNKEKASVALDNLTASLAQGYWLPKASKSARAALSKANKAQKMGRDLYQTYRTMSEDRSLTYKSLAYLEQMSQKEAIFAASMILSYGFSLGRCTEEQAKVAGQFLPKDPDNSVLLYIKAFEPVYEAMKMLDGRRPPPVFTHLGVSPTVTSTIEGYALNLKTLRMPEMVWEVQEDGSFRGRLEWPEGTKFPRRMNHGHHCGACGHKISNPYNWVPFVAEDAGGTPQGFWVGRDCAQSVFGVKVTGEVKLSEGPGKQDPFSPDSFSPTKVG